MNFLCKRKFLFTFQAHTPRIKAGYGGFNNRTNKIFISARLHVYAAVKIRAGFTIISHFASTYGGKYANSTYIGFLLIQSESFGRSYQSPKFSGYK
jgi:hypothetical protein